MRTFLACLILCTALGGTAAADSPAPDWTVRGFTVERWMGTSSAVTLATDPISGGGIAVERRATTISLPGPFAHLDITGELAFDAGSTDGTTFDQLENHIDVWQVTAGARARFPLLSWLHLQARGSVGPAHTDVRIASRNMATAITDSEYGTVASTGLGLSLLPRVTAKDRGAFHMGLEIEVGYQVATATTIHAYPEDRPPEELTIPSMYASLGDLDLEGWTLRLGATIGW